MSRFAEGLRNDGAQAPENTVLVRTPDLVALPTIGMIVPDWLLVVPTNETINFAQQHHSIRAQLPVMIAELTAIYGGRGRDFILFEHGAAETGSQVGCGVDYAHVHVLFGDPGFISSVWGRMRDALTVSATSGTIADAYSQISGDAPYYMVVRGDAILLEERPKVQISQRFRRLVAEAAGNPDRWDYRKFPFHENVTSTIQRVYGSVMAA